MGICATEQLHPSRRHFPLSCIDDHLSKEQVSTCEEGLIPLCFDLGPRPPQTLITSPTSTNRGKIVIHALIGSVAN